MKKLKVLMFLFVFVAMQMISLFSFAQKTEKSDFLLIPDSEEYKTDGIQRVERVSNSGGHVWDQYDKEAYDIGGSDSKNSNSVGEQMATGILNRNSIIDFLAHSALPTLSQLAMLVGAVMFIINGYQYASFAIGGDTPNKTKLYYAIGGILVVIFSYAIMRILTSMFIT